MPDVHAALLEYSNVPVYMRLNLGTETTPTYRFMGSKGTLDIANSVATYTPQTGKDSEPSYYAESFAKPERDAYIKKWHQENDPIPGQEPSLEGISYQGSSMDDTKPHLYNFFQAVRSRKPVLEDAIFGHHAALACHMVNESYFRKSSVTWDEASQTIKS